MTTQIIVLLGALVTVCGRVPPKHFTEVDILRDTTITLIDDLWTNITGNSDWIYNSQKMYGTDTAVLLAFKSFCDRLDRFVPSPVPNTAVENIWNYARIQVELTGINGLYGNFRKYHQEPPHKYKMFQRAWEDLAETVLQATDTLPSIPNALESIHYLITGSSDQTSEQPSLYGIICEVLTNIFVFPTDLQLYNFVYITSLFTWPCAACM